MAEAGEMQRHTCALYSLPEVPPAVDLGAAGDGGGARGTAAAAEGADAEATAGRAAEGFETGREGLLASLGVPADGTIGDALAMLANVSRAQETDVTSALLTMAHALENAIGVLVRKRMSRAALDPEQISGATVGDLSAFEYEEEVAEALAGTDDAATPKAAPPEHEGRNGVHGDSGAADAEPSTEDPDAAPEPADAPEGTQPAAAAGGAAADTPQATHKRKETKQLWQNAVRRASFSRMSEYKGSDLIAKIASHTIKKQRISQTKKVWDAVVQGRQWVPEEHTLRGKLYHVLSSWQFQTGITALVIFSWMNQAMMSTTWVRHHDNSDTFLFALNAIDLLSLSILTGELLGFIAVFGWRFVLKGWHFLDLAVLVVSWVTFWTSMRVLRIIRVLRILRQIGHLRILVESFILALPSIFWVLLVILIYMSIFSVVGVEMFHKRAEDHFGDLSTGIFTLFKAITLEGWVEDSIEIEAQTGESEIKVFYVVFIIVNSFILMNLLIGLVVDSMRQIGAVKRRQILAEEEEENGENDDGSFGWESNDASPEPGGRPNEYHASSTVLRRGESPMLISNLSKQRPMDRGAGDMGLWFPPKKERKGSYLSPFVLDDPSASPGRARHRRHSARASA